MPHISVKKKYLSTNSVDNFVDKAENRRCKADVRRVSQYWI